ncbi:MAG: CDP-alcohol phosphatidyltransferase family protein [Steroidobacteraceae bacterium]
MPAISGPFTRIPLLLTGLRALLAPVVALLALYEPKPAAFALCLVAAFVSDIFDGVIARRLKVATPSLRRLDSAADTLFYTACVFATWRLFPAAITERLLPLGVLVALEVLRYLLDFTKFHREASYHMWSSKLWGVSLFIGFFSLLVLGSAGAAVSLAIYVGIAADLEGIAISFILPRWQADIPSFVHAMQVRRDART